MNKEIERKFAVKYLPENLNVESIVHIKQAFIYRDKLTLIRIRDIKESYPKDKQIYIYTLKTKGDIEYNNNYDVAKKYEIENEIIKIPIENNLKVEIDIYYDYLEGLLTAEIEFSNEELANKFQKPAWLGKELGYKQLSNRKLAEMTKDEWQKEVTKEMIENNNIIIKQLKDNYNIK